MSPLTSGCWMLGVPVAWHGEQDSIRWTIGAVGLRLDTKGGDLVEDKEESKRADGRRMHGSVIAGNSRSSSEWTTRAATASSK